MSHRGGAGRLLRTGTTPACVLVRPVLAVMLVFAMGCAGEPAPPTRTGSVPSGDEGGGPEPPPFENTTSAPRAGRATGLAATAGCEGTGPNNHVADFSWSPAASRGSEQRLVLSYLPRGLDTGAFIQTPPLRPDETQYRWRQLNPGGRRYWRVLTRHGDAWVASETATFPAVEC